MASRTCHGWNQKHIMDDIMNTSWMESWTNRGWLYNSKWEKLLLTQIVAIVFWIAFRFFFFLSFGGPTFSKNYWLNLHTMKSVIKIVKSQTNSRKWTLPRWILENSGKVWCHRKGTRFKLHVTKIFSNTWYFKEKGPILHNIRYA